MWMRLCPALLMALVACGPMPPPESPVVESEAPSTPPAAASTPEAPRAGVRGSGSVTGARIVDADRTMMELRGRMRTCYQQALTQHPSEAGDYSFTMHVDAQGSVTSTEGHGDGALSPETLACLSGVLNSTHFSAPEGPSATLEGQLTFAPVAALSP